MSGPPIRPGTGGDDMAVLAGEHVLGLLPPEEAHWVEAERRRDPELEGMVLFWQERFLALDDTVETRKAAPDPALWARIAHSLDEAEAGAAAAPLRAAPSRRERPGPLARLEAAVWSSLAFWRATGAVAAAAALALALLPGPRPPAPAQPVAVAILQTRAEQPRPGIIVEIHAGGVIRLVPLVGADVPPDRAMQLWTLRDRAEGPLSLGLVSPGGGPLAAPDILEAIRQGQLFEITLEPATGSPTGRPTGPVLFIGNAVRPGAA